MVWLDNSGCLCQNAMGRSWIHKLPLSSLLTPSAELRQKEVMSRIQNDVEVELWRKWFRFSFTDPRRKIYDSQICLSR